MYRNRNRIIRNDKPLIQYLIVHHTAGNQARNRKAESLKRSLSNTGYSRGYKKIGYKKVKEVYHRDIGKTIFMRKQL